MVDNIAHESNTANECTSMHVPEIPRVRNEVNPSQEDHDVKPSEQLEKPLSLKELELYQMEVRKLKLLGGDGERGYFPDDALLVLPESLGKNGSINANRVFQNDLSEEVMVVDGVTFHLSLMNRWNLTFTSKRARTRVSAILTAGFHYGFKWRGSSIHAKNSAWFGASAQDVWLQNGLLSFKHHEFMEEYECPLQSPRTLLFELFRDLGAASP
ncbi:hypothetical protein DVH24_012386 [Malus domestica]|uniref:Uncharacterized protein n=1 Tax=Malus domestica TaxID=3750 RepID=A0A498HRW6_MALDO|nr:hypothetical protein DVH24_012386 [Malus domestica]